jgi:hypothetical protein
MSSMTYDQRIAYLSNWFRAELAPRFNLPRDVDPKIAVSDLIEAINSLLPNQLTPEQIGNLLSSTTKEVARSAKSRTLPPIKDFTDALRGVLQARTVPLPTHPSQAHVFDPLRLAIKRIQEGLPVGEHWLKGPMRQQLKSAGITEDQMRPYDLYIAAHTQYLQRTQTGEEQ